MRTEGYDQKLQAAPTEEAVEPEHDRTTIIVVAPDDALASVLARLLSGAGRTVMAASADECSRLVKSHPPCLVVLDVAFPEGRIAAYNHDVRERLAPTPVVFLTDQEHYLTQRCFNLATDSYVVKPFEPTELASLISAVLRRRGTAAESGDEDPLAGLYDAFYRRWLRRAVQLAHLSGVRRGAGAHEVADDALMVMWREFPGLLAPDYRAGGFRIRISDAAVQRRLGAIVRNKCLARHRSERRYDAALLKVATALSVEAEMRSGSSETALVEAGSELELLLQSLSDRDAQILADRYLTGASYDEIASRYGITPGRVRHVVSAALKELRAAVAGF